MKVRRLKNEEQKSKEETEKKKPDLRFCVVCDELGLFFRKPERGELECVCERGEMESREPRGETEHRE